jgi:glycosyltransferase involved in cell wall biosynthesis
VELISVIVPIYKVEAYLDKCVQSIVNQTYHNLEIILVDDGSPDNCPTMCDAWAQKDRRIKVVHKKNGGLSDARNAGLAMATGQMVSFIDSDDWIDPEFLQTLYDALQQNNAQIAECAIRLVDEEGHVLSHRGPGKSETIEKIQALRRLVMEAGVFQTVWNKLYRREAIGDILFEKGKCNEDDFWTYQIFDRIDRLALVDEPMLNYLQRGGSIMGQGYSLKRLDGLEARFLRWQYLQKYEELACLTRQQFHFDCMWQLQCALRLLDGEERSKAVRTILDRKKQTPKVSQRDLTVNAKYRIWYGMFTIAPNFTARVRNLLKIGC